MGSTSRFPAQLGNYLWRLVRLDLGFSSIYGKPVASVILERLPPTILLMTASLSFAFFFGLLFGVIAARGVNRWPDTLISTLGLIFYATPSFWFGLMAIVVFSVYLQWLPPGGFEDIGTVQTGIWRVFDIASHLVLPTLTLGLIFLAIYLRIMRASMLEVLNLDYVRTARAKGLDETRVVTRHVLRNALLPMVTLIGLQAGTMLGGSVVVESVFSLPGLGRLAYESVVQRDLNTLLGIVFVSALLVIIGQLRRRPDLRAARPAHCGGGLSDGRDQALFPKSRRRRRPDPAAGRDRDGDLAPAGSIRAIRWRSPAVP